MALAQTPPATALVVAMASATRATALASVAQPAQGILLALGGGEVVLLDTVSAAVGRGMKTLDEQSEAANAEDFDLLPSFVSLVQ